VRMRGGRNIAVYLAATTARIWLSSSGCDLGERFGLNLDQREYDAHPFPPQFSKEQLARDVANAAARATGPPTFRIEETTVDTGERTGLFRPSGTARHHHKKRDGPFQARIATPRIWLPRLVHRSRNRDFLRAVVALFPKNRRELLTSRRAAIQSKESKSCKKETPSTDSRWI